MEEEKKPKKKIDEETLNGLKESYGALPKALDAEKNRELLEKYKETGDIEIRNQIACGNLRFAVKYAYKYFQNVVFKCYKDQVGDLIHDLTISLFKTIEKFDTSKEYTFLTFASSVIRNDLLMKFRKTKLLKNKAVIVSFSSPTHSYKGGDEIRYEDVLTDEKFTEENFVTSADLKYILEKIVPTLPERDRILFTEFFIEGKSRSECAKSIGLANGSMPKAITELRKKIVLAYENGIAGKEGSKGKATQTYSQGASSFEEMLTQQAKRDQNILRDYFAGKLTLKEVAAKYNISIGNVNYIVREFKYDCELRNVEVPKRMKPQSNWARQQEQRALSKQKTQQRNEAVVKDYVNGLLMREIAEKHSLTVGNVGYIVSKWKAEQKNEGKEALLTSKVTLGKKERNKNIFADYMAGEMTTDEIAEKYSISKALVRYVVAKTKAELTQRGENVPRKKRVQKLKNPVVLKQANQIEAAISLDDVLALLTDKRRKIFESYQNADGTVKDVAKGLGISQAYVLDVVTEVKRKCKEKGIEMPKMSRQIVKIAVLKGFEDGTLTFEQVDKFMGKLTESQRQALYDWKEQKTQERKQEQCAKKTSEPDPEKDVTDSDRKINKAKQNGDKDGKTAESDENGGKNCV